MKSKKKKNTRFKKVEFWVGGDDGRQGIDPYIDGPYDTLQQARKQQNWILKLNRIDERDGVPFQYIPHIFKTTTVKVRG